MKKNYNNRTNEASLLTLVLNMTNDSAFPYIITTRRTQIKSLFTYTHNLWVRKKHSLYIYSGLHL